jgi:hypothetical protein
MVGEVPLWVAVDQTLGDQSGDQTIRGQAFDEVPGYEQQALSV